MFLGMVCYTIRVCCYSILPGGSLAWLVLLIEPLHGITFGVFYSASVTYISRVISREGTSATWQGVFSGIFSLGKAGGSIGGGYLYTIGGGVLLYRCSFAVSLAGTLLFAGVVFTDRGHFKENEGTILKELSLVEDAFSADEDEDDKFAIDRDASHLWEDDDLESF